MNNMACSSPSNNNSHSLTPLKIYFIPFLTPSHMFQLSRLFAARGHHVTILTTPSNALSLQTSIISHSSSPHPFLRFHTIPFPSNDVVDNLFLAPDFAAVLKFFQVFHLLHHRMEHFMLSHPPDCIVSDSFFPWTSDFALRIGIPRLVFDGFSIFAASLIESVRALRPGSEPEHEPLTVPGLPHPITMTRCQLPDYAKSRDGFTQLMEKFREAEVKSHGRLVNGFVELEADYARHYQKIMGGKIWHVGPASLVHAASVMMSEQDRYCLRWLDSKKPDSVVYICFGSSCFFSDSQLYEIAKGIESAGHPFVWVVFRKDRDEAREEEEKWLPLGFDDDQEKGMIVRGWAPQVAILGHVAVGGFVTHCGWNSVVEGICAGVPLITWPLTAEQFYNEKFVTQVHGIGVEVGSEEWTLTAGHERKKVVSGERVEKAVRKVMDGGDEATEMRKRVRELEVKAKAALEEGGSSQNNLTALIEDLIQIRAKRSAP